MIRISDSTLRHWLDEDVYNGDLTTSLLGIGSHKGELLFTTRHATVLCGCEEVVRIAQMEGLQVVHTTPSGRMLGAKEEFLAITGNVAALHRIWKVTLNILEHASGVATYTAEIVEAAKDINPLVQIATTRKTPPGMRQLLIKAIMSGGAVPHRLGLSESVLVFEEHMAFMGGHDAFCAQLDHLHHLAPEKVLTVEAHDLESALKFARSGAQLLQVDKFSPAQVEALKSSLQKEGLPTRIAAAGGVNAANVADYVRSGADIIVTSAPYAAKPADISGKIHSL